MMSDAEREELGRFVRGKLRGMDSDRFLELIDDEDIAPAWEPSKKGKGRPYSLIWAGRPLRRMMPLVSYNRVMQSRRQGMDYEAAVRLELERMEEEGIAVLPPGEGE